jgi:hypothetical protein
MSLRGDDLPIERPCPVELSDEFRSGAPTRHCGHCDKTVHLLSSLTRREAEVLLAANGDRDMCVTYLVDARGEIQFRPEPTVVPASSLARRRPALAAAGLSAVLAACAPHDNPTVRAHAVDDPIAHREDAPTIPTEPCETSKPRQLEPGAGLAAGGIRPSMMERKPEPEPAPPTMSAGRPMIRKGGFRAR